MSGWKGIDGKRYSPAEFRELLSARAAPAWAQMVVLHNTGNPSLDPLEGHGSWYGSRTSPKDRVNNGLVHYYKNIVRWSAGPHCFVDRDGVWVFTPPWLQGVHSPSWNSIAWGIEMVGDFEVEQFDERVRGNAVEAAAALLEWRGLPADVSTIKLHKEDRRTTHACPGKNVDKLDMVRRIAARMESDGEHDPSFDEAGDGSATPAHDDASAPTSPPIKVVVDWDLIRFRASPNGDVKGTLPRGVTVEVLGSDAGWLKVRTPAGYVGWISEPLTRRLT